jgi:hypothetical protein
MFKTYLELGFKHILDLNAYDHILFVMTLCAVFLLKDWKKVLILVTAFTIGHSLTLALSVFKIVAIDSNLIETLIPITIIFTALANIYHVFTIKDVGKWSYISALVFGFIHGLGFSNMLKVLLGEEEDVLKPLLAFNLGVEFGQLPIVFISMALSFIMCEVFKMSLKIWSTLISLVSIVVSLYLLVK